MRPPKGSQELIYDGLRKSYLKATPEELVRQSLIKLMLEELEYPKSLLALEKTLKDLVGSRHFHLKLPNRRVDIICYQKGSCMPLLMIECKAIALSKSAFRQVIGYNRYINSPFVALASPWEVLLGFKDQKTHSYKFIEKLPSYTELTTLLKKS